MMRDTLPRATQAAAGVPLTSDNTKPCDSMAPTAAPAKQGDSYASGTSSTRPGAAASQRAASAVSPSSVRQRRWPKFTTGRSR